MDLLLVMAVLPAAWLLRYVYRLDPVEKEPMRMLVGLLILGAISCIPAIIWESVALDILLPNAEAVTIEQLIIENFLVIALAEETCKMFFLRLRTWRSKQFNYVFDGIVYGVFVSLGFAILENIGYVTEFGMATALLRAVTAIPGHAIFGAFMGYFYGLEKLASVEGKRGRQICFAILSLVVPVLCHGFYDFCASAPDEVFMLVFFVFLIAMVIIAARLAKWMARQARPLNPALSQGYGFVSSAASMQQPSVQFQQPEAYVQQPFVQFQHPEVYGQQPSSWAQQQPASQFQQPASQRSASMQHPPQPGVARPVASPSADPYWGSNQASRQTYTLHW